MQIPAFLCGVVALGLLASAEIRTSPGLLKPGFGVVFTPVGYVQPALDHRFLILDIEVPHYTPIIFDDNLDIE